MQQQRTRAPKITPIKRGSKKVWRVQVWDPVGVFTDGEPGWVSACKVLDMPGTLFDTKGEANEIAKRANEIVSRRRDGRTTIEDAFERWYRRPLDKEASRLTSAERVRPFVRRHPGKLIALITDEDAADYAENYDEDGGRCPSSHVEGLRSFFTFCVERGWIPESPFRPAIVRSNKGKGNRRVNPPSQAIVERMIEAGWDMLPSVGAWLACGAWIASRPGETHTLRWGDFTADLSGVRIERQWNTKEKRITLPKNGLIRDVIVPEQAQDALRRLRRQTGVIDPNAYVFTNTLGDHWRNSALAYHWKGIKAAVPEIGANPKFTPYMCTRHFAGWYMVNVLEMEADVVAMQMGHEDDGDLVRKLYGHRDRTRALRMIADAHKRENRKRDDGDEAVAV